MRYGKLSLGLTLVCVLVCMSDCFGQGDVIYRNGPTAFLNNTCAGNAATASCSGASSLRTPVRNLVTARPLRTAAGVVFQSVSTFQNNRCGILQRISSVRAASCGAATDSCAGQSQAAPMGCASSMVAPQAAPCPCGCHQGNPCTCKQPAAAAASAFCPTGTCNLAESHASFATPVRSFVSNTYQQALASAQYRAANRIHGHCYLDTHRTSGVGWATSNPKPNTCLGGDNGSTYAVAQGADGWYATKF